MTALHIFAARSGVGWANCLRCCSATDRLHELLGIALTLDSDFGGRALDLCEVIGRQIDVRRPEILLEPVELDGASCALFAADAVAKETPKSWRSKLL